MQKINQLYMIIFITVNTEDYGSPYTKGKIQCGLQDVQAGVER